MLPPMPRKTKALAVAAHAPTIVPPAKRVLNFGGKWEYAPAPEAVAVKPSPKYDLFIGGKFVEPTGGAYFPSSWDEEHVKPLLAMSDPGEAPLKSSVLVAQSGKGYYVYTGLAFFRQLPAGVPGAYRLFANLLSLGAANAVQIGKPR